MINIKKSHRGLFTKEAKAAGVSVAKFTNKVLVPGSRYSKAVKKRANFARNARKWNHSK
jgi:hypothetical protein